MDFDSPLSNFRKNLESVSKLVNFDKEVQELAIGTIETLHKKLVDQQGITNPQLNGERTLQILRGIRQSPVLRERYSLIYNQAVVLLVSYFGSVIGDVFRMAAAQALRENNAKVLETELKMRVTEILALSEAADQKIGDLIIRKDDISFQDMQSTHRAFKRYFGVEIEPTDTVRNIIAAQACRHAIVHNGAKVNERTINQVRNAEPRTLKADVSMNQNIVFSIEEITEISENMLSYISGLIDAVRKATSRITTGST